MKLTPEIVERNGVIHHFEPKANGHDKRADRPAINYRRVSDITAQPIRWLWPGRFACGKVSMIAGNPGLAKSTVTVSMTAVVTTGGRWPLDDVRASIGSVIFLSAEDDPADTIKPRLMAAGADTNKCYVIDAIPDTSKDGAPCLRSFNLQSDLARLETMIEAIGDVAMVVIDPISAYLGGTDSHKNAEVRAALAPVSEMAARYGVAVVCVSHLNKGGAGEALLRVTGSLAFVAAARAAYVVTRDKEDPSRRLFLPLKNNLGNDQAGLSFSVEGLTIEGDIETSRILWDREAVTVTADEAMQAVEADDGQTSREDITAWLRDLLAPGRMKSSDVQAKAKQAGYAWRSVQRALKEGGFVSKREGFGQDIVSYWSQPPLTPETPFAPKPAFAPTRANGENVARMDGAGANGDTAPHEGTA